MLFVVFENYFCTLRVSVPCLRQRLQVQSKPAKFLHENVERLWRTRFEEVVSFCETFVSHTSALKIVRFDRQHFLQYGRGTIRLQSPYFHFSKALATELCLTPDWLLGNEGVAAGRACVHLVLGQVNQLEDVCFSYGNLAIEVLAIDSVSNVLLATVAKSGLAQKSFDLFLGSAVEHGRHGANVQHPGSHAQTGLKKLADVHA